MSDRSAAVGYGLLVLTAAGWSGAWITARLAAHEAPPMTVTVGRFALAALALVPAWFVLDRGKRIRLTRRDGVVLTAMSATGITTYTVLFLIGVSLAPASDGAVITPGFVGLFSVIIAWVGLGQRPRPSGILGALVALGGSLLVGYHAIAGEGPSSDRFLGDLVFVAAAAAYGAYTVLGRQLSETVPPVTAISVASAIGAVGLAPIALAVEGVPDPTGWTWRAWLNIGYLGLVATAVSFVTYYAAVHRIGVERTAPALGLVPVFTVLAAGLILGEALTILHALGGGLVLVGIVLPAWARARAREQGEAPPGDAPPGEEARR